MAVPSKEDFRAYLGLLARCQAPQIAQRLWTELPSSVAAIKALYLEGQEKIVGNFVDAMSNDVDKWLMDQRTFQVARDRAFRKNRRAIGIEEQHNRTAEEIHVNLQGFLKAESQGEKKAFKFRKQIGNYFAMPAIVRWKFGVAASLVEYHYNDNAAKIASCHSDLPTFVEETRRDLEKIKKILELQFSCHNDIVDWSGFSGHIERALQNLDRRLSPEVRELYPIKRNDKTARERLFVFWMERCHNSLFRTSRPEAISLLLDLEGIRTSLDMRQVEKICASFREARIKRRRLMQDYD